LVIKLTNGEEIPITAVRVTSLTFKKEISFSSIELFDARNKLIKSILVGRNRDITWLSSDMKIVELSKNSMILEYIVSRSKKGNEALQTERIKIDSSEKKFILENVGQVQVYEKKTACFIEQIKDVVLLVKPGFTRNPNDLPRANFSYEVRINLNDASDILVVKTERFDEGFDLVNCLKRYIKYCRNGESSTELNQFDHSYDKMLEKSQHQQPLEKSD
jgi:hypothetical protein